MVMHGRLKIKSTAQQKAEREEAQRKKLAAYQAAFSDAMARRGAGAHDKETLARVATVLEKNPDVASLWIFRREMFTKMGAALPNDEYQALLDSELEFIVTCLRVNPKSYYTWHHRCWVLLNAPSPNWDRELALCTRFLSLDERNFHCWDYRRWLVQQIGVCTEKELEFVTTKLYENFSNFSAWHYRSRLIPKSLGQPPGDNTEDLRPASLPRNVLIEELDLVRNALYVDPTDQSPWFYHRWLLANCTDRRTILHSVLVDSHAAIIHVAFSRPVALSVVTELRVTITIDSDEEEQKLLHVTWRPARPRKASALWCAQLPDGLTLVDTSWRLSVLFDSSQLICESRDSTPTTHARTEMDPAKFFAAPSDLKVASLITNELDSIRELHSMEPSSKWVVLGLCALLRLTAPLQTEAEVCALLEQLGRADPLRSAFYVDFRSRMLSENAISRCFQTGVRSFALPKCLLTALKGLDWLVFMTEIDLSENRLKVLPEDCRYLTQLQRLNLDWNQLTSLKPLVGLPALEVLMVRGNALERVEDAAPVLFCPALRSFDIRENAVAQKVFNPLWDEQLQVLGRSLELLR